MEGFEPTASSFLSQPSTTDITYRYYKNLARVSGIEPEPRSSEDLALPLCYTPSILLKWSEWQDSNLRHLAPKASGLPD